MKILASCVVLILITLSLSCSHIPATDKSYRTYIAYAGRDTVMLHLSLVKKDFYGQYKVKGPGRYLVTGDINGIVYGDTLLGSLSYTPFGWKNKKRKAFALLKDGNTYQRGSGSETVYMGIPSFQKNTLTFGKEVFVLLPEEN